MLTAVGLDGMQLLRTEDSAERSALIALADQLVELRAQEREDLAVRIVNALSRAMK